MFGYEVTVDDVEAVMKKHALRVTNANGMSFSAMAEMLLPTIDQTRVESAALKYSTEMDEQTEAAYREIEIQLVESGVLEGPDLVEPLADTEGDGLQILGEQWVMLSLSVRYQAEGVSAQDLGVALERNVQTAVGMGLLTDDGPCTVNEWNLVVNPVSAAASNLSEQDIEEWLRSRVEDGNLDVEDLIKLASRYAMADRTQLLEELAERIEAVEDDESIGASEIADVSAEVWTDDRALSVEFNAAGWMNSAEAGAIVSLAECGWRGDYPADAVAEWEQERNPKVAKLFKYVEALQQVQGCDIGFECSVDEHKAMEWLRGNRKGVWAMIRCGFESVRLVETEENESKGRWLWIGEHGQASETSFQTKEEAALNAVDQLWLVATA